MFRVAAPPGTMTMSDIDGARHVDELRIVAVGELGPRPARVIDDRHAERLKPARDGDADAAHADQADGAVAQRRPAQRIVALAPFAGAQMAFGLRQLAHRAQEQADRGIGDFLGEHVGRVGDDDAAPRRGVGVDVVVADAEAGDDVRGSAGARASASSTGSHRRADRHGAHMADRSKECVAVRRPARLCTVKSASPLAMTGRRRPDQQHVRSFVPAMIVLLQRSARRSLAARAPPMKGIKRRHFRAITRVLFAESFAHEAFFGF